MTAAAVSTRVRRFVLAGVVFLLAWQGARLAGVPRRTGVVLGLPGFVLHVLFGKAYSLLPAYFDRELAWPRAPAVQLPLTVLGVLCLATAPLDGVPAGVRTIGAVSWALGVGVFLAALGSTLRRNLSGAATGTGAAKADRRRTDRLANAVLPVALLYLVAATYATLASATGVPPLLDGYPPRATHLLAAGTATLFVFGVGFRLLPRFFVATPPRVLVPVVLVAGAIAPGLLAATLWQGTAFRAAAVLEAVAVVGYAAGVAVLHRRSSRRRVGLFGVLAGAAFGVLGVLAGVAVAFGVAVPALVEAHLRTNLLGFLGLTIVGVTYQFYPPAVGDFRGAGDRTALASLGLLGGGLLVEDAGLVAGSHALATAGVLFALVGAGLWALLLVGLFRQR